MKSDFNSCGPETARCLADLAPGTEAVVIGVDLDDATGRRLRDLGLLPRTRIRVVRRAPLGDPCVYALRGYRLCLRRADARHVLVRIQATPPPADAGPTRPD
jgi:Fe2+ transport system protein FeoA